MELVPPDERATKRISRYQFELIRSPEKVVLKNTSSRAMIVDGNPVEESQTVQVRSGTEINVRQILVMHLLSQDDPTAQESKPD